VSRIADGFSDDEEEGSEDDDGFREHML